MALSISDEQVQTLRHIALTGNALLNPPDDYRKVRSEAATRAYFDRYQRMIGEWNAQPDIPFVLRMPTKLARRLDDLNHPQASPHHSKPWQSAPLDPDYRNRAGDYYSGNA